MEKYERTNLDLLRSLAVLSVFIDHLVNTLRLRLNYHNSTILGLTVSIGQAGVLAFFVHTSLVLMYSLERLHEGVGPVTKRFYVRRLFRIYPLAILCIFVAVLLRIPAEAWRKPAPVSGMVILANVLLVQTLITRYNVLGPLWSLPYEIQMYVVLPFLYRITTHRRAVAILLGLIGGSCLLGILIALKTSHLNMAAYLPCFLAGVLCYALRTRQAAILPAMAWPAFVLFLIVTYCSVHFWRLPIYWVGWIYSLFLGASINLFRDCRWVRFNAVTSSLAKYSYGLYLWHMPMLYLVFVVLSIRNIPLGALVCFALSLITSIVTYHAVEAPFIEMGRRVGSKPIKTIS